MTALHPDYPDHLADGWHHWDFAAARDAPGSARAAQTFTAHSRNPRAAAVLTSWFRDHSLDPGSRTYVLVRGQAIAAYFAVRAGAVALSPSDANKLRADDPNRVPGLHIAYLARADGSAYQGAGHEALLYAAKLAQSLDALVTTSVLVVDPYDEHTEAMWRERFGFWSTKERCSNGCRRLYIPVHRAVPRPQPSVDSAGETR